MVISLPSTKDCAFLFSRALPVCCCWDQAQRFLAIWQLSSTYFFGTVTSQNRDIVLIPAHKITSPLGGSLKINRIANCRWHLVYEETKGEMMIWPRMVAAGREECLALEEGSLEDVEVFRETIFAFRTASLEHAIHVAIGHGNMLVARWLVQNCPDQAMLAASNAEGETPLKLAAAFSAWELIEDLVKKGLDLGEGELEALLRAEYDPILKGIFSKIQLSFDQLQHYLLIAAQAGNHRAITEVLEPKGANINSFQGPLGWSLVHYLARSDGIFLLKRLLKEEMDLKSLAAIAATHGSRKVLEYLLILMKKNGVSLEKCCGNKHLLYIALEGGTEDVVFKIYPLVSLVSSVLDEKNRRAVHVAAGMGSVRLLEQLFFEGADLTVEDGEGMSPFDFATRAEASCAVEFLLGKIVPPAKKAPSLQSQGRTPIFRAIEEGKEEEVDALIAQGVSLHHTDDQRMTPLGLASLLGHLSIANKLLKQGVDPNQRIGIARITALHIAVQREDEKLVRCLLMQGADVSILGEGEIPLIQILIQKGLSRLVRLFVARGVSLNEEGSRW